METELTKEILLEYFEKILHFISCDDYFEVFIGSFVNIKTKNYPQIGIEHHKPMHERSEAWVIHDGHGIYFDISSAEFYELLKKALEIKKAFKKNRELAIIDFNKNHSSPS